MHLCPTKSLKGIDRGPVTNPAAQMDHVGGQGQQILENTGQEFSMRFSASLSPALAYH